MIIGKHKVGLKRNDLGNMNRIRVFTSGGLFLFALYCLFFNQDLPFHLPSWMYLIATIYFAYFPIKDIFSCTTHSLYKGRQFKKNYIADEDLDDKEFYKMKHTYDKRACYSYIFWILFMAVPGFLYVNGCIGRICIFVFFTLSNFSVFYAIFGWCPFHYIFIKPDCCMECRIYNWDSFFQYSFLIFLPNPYTILLCTLGFISLIKWEVTHARYPKRFYKSSNQKLSCANCDLDACRKHKKKLFHKTLKEEYQEHK